MPQNAALPKPKAKASATRDQVAAEQGTAGGAWGWGLA